MSDQSQDGVAPRATTPATPALLPWAPMTEEEAKGLAQLIASHHPDYRAEAHGIYVPGGRNWWEVTITERAHGKRLSPVRSFEQYVLEYRQDMDDDAYATALADEALRRLPPESSTRIESITLPNGATCYLWHSYRGSTSPWSATGARMTGGVTARILSSHPGGKWADRLDMKQHLRAGWTKQQLHAVIRKLALRWRAAQRDTVRDA